MQHPKPIAPEVLARKFAVQIFERRRALIRAGGHDPLIQTLIQSANADFQGDLKAAAEAALAVVEREIEEAVESETERRMAAIARMKSPQTRAEILRMFALIEQAALLRKEASRAASAGSLRNAKIADLMRQGVAAEAAEQAAGQAPDPAALLEEAEKLSREAAEIEKNLGKE